MKILYDHQIFSSQKFGGVSRYFYELIKEYSSMDDMFVDVSLIFSNNHYISNSELVKHKNFFPKLNFKGKGRIQSLLNEYLTIQMLKKRDFNVFHPTYYDPYFLKYIGNKPFVLTVYDMIHEKFKDIFPLNDPTAANKKILAEKSSKIIAISASTKNDLVDILGINEDKIDVVYLGSSIESANPVKLSFKLPHKYILFVGFRNRHKNFNRFITAVAPLLKSDDELNVVCAGGGRFKQDEIEILNNLNIINHVQQYDVDDNILAEFYKRTLLFVFPSLYEGFGIPVLEAFACACPMACSNSSSLPEIGGDGAIYFDPYSIDSIHDVVQNGIYNDALRETLISNGRERLQKFSWKKTAEETKRIYEGIL